MEINDYQVPASHIFINSVVQLSLYNGTVRTRRCTTLIEVVSQSRPKESEAFAWDLQDSTGDHLDRI